MLSDHDPLEILQSRIKSLGVGSTASVSSFYSKQPLQQVLIDSESDSTFEPSSQSDCSTEQSEEMEEELKLIPEQEIALLQQESYEDGGKPQFSYHKASDYQPSEDEDELGGERYLRRAKGMVKSRTQGFGLEIGILMLKPGIF